MIREIRRLPDFKAINMNIDLSEEKTFKRSVLLVATFAGFSDSFSGFGS